MRGRSPFNNLSVRKRDVYRLLLKLDGEARWKDLKANLKDLGWGPTTLKQTLDEMIMEGSVIKEARLGAKGPEAWYRVQIKDSDIWEPLRKALAEGKDTSMKQIADGIRKKLQQLKGKEKEVFLKRQLRRIVVMARDTWTGLFHMEAKAAKNYGKRESLIIFDYLFDTIEKKLMKEYLEICLEYPEYTMEVTASLLREAGEKERA